MGYALAGLLGALVGIVATAWVLAWGDQKFEDAEEYVLVFPTEEDLRRAAMNGHPSQWRRLENPFVEDSRPNGEVRPFDSAS